MFQKQKGDRFIQSKNATFEGMLTYLLQENERHKAVEGFPLEIDIYDITPHQTSESIEYTASIFPEQIPRNEVLEAVKKYGSNAQTIEQITWHLDSDLLDETAEEFAVEDMQYPFLDALNLVYTNYLSQKNNYNSRTR